MRRPEHNASVKEALNIDSDQEEIRIIYTDGVLGGVLEALQAIGRGEIISIMGDRTYGYASAEALLLGGSVRFPYGAFSLAAAARCPVAVLLSAKVGVKNGARGKLRSRHACGSSRAFWRNMHFAIHISGSYFVICGKAMIDAIVNKLFSHEDHALHSRCHS
jgi:hypothetical protein